MQAMSREDILKNFPITLMRVSVFAHEGECSIKVTPFQVREVGSNFITKENKRVKVSALMQMDSKMRDDVMTNFTHCRPEQMEEAIAKVSEFVGKRIEEQLTRLANIQKNFKDNRILKIRENEDVGDSDDD